jgi:hypothetical protein
MLPVGGLSIYGKPLDSGGGWWRLLKALAHDPSKAMIAHPTSLVHNCHDPFKGSHFLFIIQTPHLHDRYPQKSVNARLPAVKPKMVGTKRLLVQRTRCNFLCEECFTLGTFFNLRLCFICKVKGISRARASIDHYIGKNSHGICSRQQHRSGGPYSGSVD